MAPRAKTQAEPGTLEEDGDVVEIEPGRAVDTQVGHRWDNRRRPKRGPHIAAHPTMVPADAEELARLQTFVSDGMKRFEYALRRKVGDETDRALVNGSDEVADR